jgi:hypothetical protein
MQTALIDFDLNDENRGVKALLIQCRPLLPSIKKHQGPGIDVILEVVGRFKEHDRPEGLYLSAEVISLLNELGGELEYDTVPDVS